MLIRGKEVDPTKAWSLLLQDFPLRMGVCVDLRDEHFLGLPSSCG